MATVLLIEDDAQVRQLVARYLERAGLAAVGAATGEEGLQMLALRPVDLVLLDVSLPGADGWSLLERIRDEWGERIAVIMLTARSDEPDRLLGLELGADDYIVKPFSPREVVARVKAVLRRAARADTVPERIELPGLLIDVAGRTVRRGDVAVALTSKEFDLLVELARHVNRVVPRAGLYEKVWGDEWEVESDHTLDVHISRLRRKLAGEDGFDYVTTVKGIGFKLEVTRHAS
jgi:two-component system response regulator ResD